MCIAPFVAATIAFNFFPPSDRVNYGDLLEPHPLPDSVFEHEGKSFKLDALKGKWILLHFDSGDCNRACEAKLFNMRQSRTAQGREMERIERVWVIQDDVMPSPEQRALYEDMYVLRKPQAQFMGLFPATTDLRGHIYLVDPLGNLMLRFPPDADPKKMIKDIQRLLKVSRIG
ncbi:MAG TPA: cytochrome C oxidase subunit I [Burkholderiales bacterium]|nr:cytochrome C oxidase subunit I [Burkholderiales bacterium]